jgi:hypothetical protein
LFGILIGILYPILVFVVWNHQPDIYLLFLKHWGYRGCFNCVVGSRTSRWAARPLPRNSKSLCLASLVQSTRKGFVSDIPSSKLIAMENDQSINILLMDSLSSQHHSTMTYDFSPEMYVLTETFKKKQPLRALFGRPWIHSNIRLSEVVTNCRFPDACQPSSMVTGLLPTLEIPLTGLSHGTHILSTNVWTPQEFWGNIL